MTPEIKQMMTQAAEAVLRGDPDAVEKATTALAADSAARLEDVAPVATRSKVFRLEREMQPLPQIHIPIKHHFSEGLYAREMTMPKNAVVTGKIHKHGQLNILSKGDVTVMTDKGRMRIQAPYTFTAPAGSKRAFFAHSESVWTVVLATNETDVRRIEMDFVVDTEEQFQDFVKGVAS